MMEYMDDYILWLYSSRFLSTYTPPIFYYLLSYFSYGKLIFMDISKYLIYVTEDIRS